MKHINSYTAEFMIILEHVYHFEMFELLILQFHWITHAILVFFIINSDVMSVIIPLQIDCNNYNYSIIL